MEPFSGIGIVIQVTGDHSRKTARSSPMRNGTHSGVLDLSSASKISNTIENTPNGGTNGWYAPEPRLARRLPHILISGSKNYTWGEDTLDDTYRPGQQRSICAAFLEFMAPTATSRIHIVGPKRSGRHARPARMDAMPSACGDSIQLPTCPASI